MGFLREPSHLLIIAIVILVLFGSRRLPDAARGLGRSLRIFKSEIQEMKNDQPPSTKPANTDPVEGKVMGEDREAQAQAEARARQAEARQAEARRDA